jgi:hypothetical protein
MLANGSPPAPRSFLINLPRADSAILLIAFKPNLSYARNPLGEPMQPNRSDAATSTSVCLWCYSQYLTSTSRARDGHTFCCKKCEYEARYWLQEAVKSAGE